VMGVFQLGSTYAAQLCQRFGLDPDEMVTRRSNGWRTLLRLRLVNPPHSWAHVEAERVRELAELHDSHALLSGFDSTDVRLRPVILAASSACRFLPWSTASR
jgi:hypothetical protein